MSNEESTTTAEADERIKETPTHWEIQIYGSYREPEGTAQEIADIKTIEELPGKAPPSVIKIRRHVYAGDMLALDYCEGGEIARVMQVASALSGVPFAMIKRMAWPDYCEVRDKVLQAIEGKG